MILKGQGQARLHLKSNDPWSREWGPVQSAKSGPTPTPPGALGSATSAPSNGARPLPRRNRIRMGPQVVPPTECFDPGPKRRALTPTQTLDLA